LTSPYGSETISTIQNLAQGIGVVKATGNVFSEGTSTLELTFTNVSVHDLAIKKIISPPVVELTPTSASKTVPVKVKIQNRGPYPETIQDAPMLTNLISLTITSLGSCQAPVPVLHAGKPQHRFPITLKSKKILTVYYDVTFDCANDPAKSTTGDPNHYDYRYSAVVTHSAIDGIADSHTVDDACPRSVTPPYVVEPYPDQTIKDKGCGAKKPDRTFGGDILTDVVVK
jgi:hypothetical protein